MNDENEKKAPEENQEAEAEPSYEEEEKLDKTMMDIDAKQFIEKAKKDKPKEEPPQEKGDESIEEMLKKEKSLGARLGRLFKKKK